MKNGTESMGASKERFQAHLQRNAGRYFGDLAEAPVSVTLVQESERLNSCLYAFRLASREASHTVFVKVPAARPDLDSAAENGSPAVARPRLFPRTQPHLKGLFEYRSLQTIHDHFSRLADPRFGTIRVLELLDDPYTLIMEKGPDPSFRQVFHRTNRVRSGPLRERLLQGCRNTGAWLKQFAGLEPLEHCDVRQAQAGELQAFLDELIRFARQFGMGAWFDPALQQRWLALADALLPGGSPLGVVHTDFAPRNVLLGADGRVTVFDTMSRWQAPIYEDLAYFLVRLKASVPQMMSQGLLVNGGLLADCETALLLGYFELQPVPMLQIRLYESILLLDQWAAMACRLSGSSRVRETMLRCQLKLMQPFLARYLRRILAEIDG